MTWYKTERTEVSRNGRLDYVDLEKFSKEQTDLKNIEVRHAGSRIDDLLASDQLMP